MSVKESLVDAIIDSSTSCSDFTEKALIYKRRGTKIEGKKRLRVKATMHKACIEL